MAQYKQNWIILVVILIAVFFIVGMVIGAMGKSKKIWITSLILLIIYLLIFIINPGVVFIVICKIIDYFK